MSENSPDDGSESVNLSDLHINGNEFKVTVTNDVNTNKSKSFVAEMEIARFVQLVTVMQSCELESVEETMFLISEFNRIAESYLKPERDLQYFAEKPAELIAFIQFHRMVQASE